MVPRKTMEGELKTQEKELSDDINSLNKKVSTLPKYYQCLLIHLVRQSSWRNNLTMRRGSYGTL
jgi:hypothetical protein